MPGKLQEEVEYQDPFSLTPEQERLKCGLENDSLIGLGPSPLSASSTKGQSKRPTLHTRLSSSGSLSQTQGMLLSPIINRISTKNQPRSLHANPKRRQFNQSEDNINVSSTALNTSEKEKRRLVEQFYNSINGSTPNKIASSMDIGSTSSRDLSSRSIENGGLSFKPFDNRILNYKGLIKWLFNIEVLTNDLLSKGNEDRPTLAPLRDVIESISAKVVARAKTSIYDPIIPESIAELLELSKSLSDVLESTQKTLEELEREREPTLHRYQDEIKQSLDKLHDTIATLDVLESKLSMIKSKISSNKNIMSSTLVEKLSTLERVNLRFAEHSRKMRKKRFQELAIAVSVIVFFFVIYLSYR
ncbi:uncharacterized protein PRCAT00003803001 [Priceomyces carsonii]|uniref:uncharacterized protein n=1 Tax=Priceomyces carsonii TaxID=28549 RepID=UPI002ED7C83E|nr:unnamed protein product [Priceomyces carsonii]